MAYKGWLLAVLLALISGCDSTNSPTNSPAGLNAQNKAAASAVAAKPLNQAELAKRYQGAELKVADASEVQLDGASTLVVSFTVPLAVEQDFSTKLHLVDSRDGTVDGAWELSPNQMELRLRHLLPKRKLVLTVDAGLRAVNEARLANEYVAKLSTASLSPTVGFASRGSLLPTRLAEGLPVITLNVNAVNVEFFRIKPDQLPNFLSRWGRSNSLSSWEADELLPLADLVYGGRFNLAPKLNTRETVLLPIANIKALQQPGMYLAVLREAGTYSHSQPATLFSLSDIGLSAHRYRQRLEVFTQALEGGAPQEKVQLELLDASGALLAQGQSNAQGMAELPLTDKAKVLLARLGEQTSVLNLATAALDLAEFDISGAPSNGLNLFVFGPRDLYRPGETVLLNALLRDADGQKVAGQPIAVELRSPDDQLARRFVWQPQSEGFYQKTLELNANAATGRWQLLFDLGDGRKSLYEFQVEDFLPERLALELSGSAQPLLSDEAAHFQVQGRYLYGAPASGNRLVSQIYQRPLRDAVANLPGYQFGSATEEELSQDYELDDQVLDDQGKTTLSPENRWSEAKSPLKLIVQSSVQESGGRPVTRRIVQPVWPAKQLPGLRGLFDGDSVDSDSQAEFELLVADAEGHKLAASQLKVRLVRERRDYFWSYSEDDGWSYHYNEKYLTQAEQRVDIAKDHTAKLSFPVEWGPYRVEVEDPTTGLVSSVRFWAGYRWQDNAEGGAVRPDQVKLALDKPAYQEGEVAQVTVTAPAAGKGYLLVESSEGPLWWQPIEVPAEGKRFELPIDKSWARHDLYLSALVVRPGQRQAQQTPRRAVGVLHLPLSRDSRKLALELNAPAKMRPNQPLAVKLKVRNADGSIPTQAKVLVAAVDVGILNITGFKTPDPFTAFFGRKAYQVDQLDVYGQLIEGQGRLASLAFGGDAALAGGGQRPPTQVQIVALQNAPVLLNEQGEAEVNLPIPDFNGELRLMAQAWTDNSFAAAEGKTVVAAPLIAELAAPRFLAGGDHSQLTLDVHNLSGTAQQVQLKITTSGLLSMNEPIVRSLSLAKDQRLMVPIEVLVHTGFGAGQVVAEITGLSLPDEQLLPVKRSWQLGVRPAYPAQQTRWRAVLKDQPQSLPAELTQGYAPNTLEGVLNLTRKPPLNLPEQVRELKAYPYGCAEQTTSGLFPFIYSDQASLAKLGIQADSDEVRRRKIELGIERLLTMQRYNGSFALWSRDGDEEYWLTAYISDFLLRAREQGFAVPEQALSKASARLLRYVQDRTQIYPDYVDDLAHLRFAVQAYAGYVLSRSQQAPLGALRSLFERRAEVKSALPLVHLAIALQRMGDGPRAEQALAAALAMQPEANSSRWLGDYGSRLRDEALMVNLLSEQQWAQPSRDQLLLQLSDDLQQADYLSTQERNALFMAGRWQASEAEGNWRARLASAQGDFSLSAEQPSLKLEAPMLEAGKLELLPETEQTLYASVQLSGYPQASPAPQSQNLRIERQYLDVKGKPLNLEAVRSGELVLVHLAVSAKERVSDALLVDLLPAGLELENQNLAQSSASLSDAAGEVRQWQEQMQESSRIKHQEFRDDRYVAAVDVDSSTIHLLYLARAVTPGRYRVPAPQVESMYRPNWRALGEATADLVVVPR